MMNLLVRFLTAECGLAYEPALLLLLTQSWRIYIQYVFTLFTLQKCMKFSEIREHLCCSVFLLLLLLLLLPFLLLRYSPSLISRFYPKCRNFHPFAFCQTSYTVYVVYISAPYPTNCGRIFVVSGRRSLSTSTLTLTNERTTSFFSVGDATVAVVAVSIDTYFSYRRNSSHRACYFGSSRLPQPSTLCLATAAYIVRLFQIGIFQKYVSFLHIRN